MGWCKRSFASNQVIWLSRPIEFYNEAACGRPLSSLRALCTQLGCRNVCADSGVTKVGVQKQPSSSQRGQGSNINLYLLASS